MQSCWMEDPLMRPTFEDITKQIKYLLRKNPVCTTCLLVTVIVSAFSNPVVFFLPFSGSVYLKKISLVNYYHFLCNSFQTHEQFIKFKQSKSWPWGCLDIKDETNNWTKKRKTRVAANWFLARKFPRVYTSQRSNAKIQHSFRSRLYFQVCKEFEAKMCQTLKKKKKKLHKTGNDKLEH